jgi:hypothetical protein
MHCCGGNNYQVGYKDYRVTPIGQNFSVPDSCCFEYVEGCGYHIFHKSDVEIANHIYVHGCLTLLKDQVMEGLKQLIFGECSYSVKRHALKINILEVQWNPFN